jgi:CheY-like chemotaxis protein
MIKKVLLVDDDQDMLHTLEEGLQQYRDTFTVIKASNGTQALSSLEKNVISLVVTDLKMPGMDGFEVLAYIMEHFPYIPVIIITGYSTPDMQRMAREGGAVGYIAKPFLVENLARQIMTTLRKESEGGTLHNVSSGIFLQLVEMEQKTCTIHLEDKTSGKKGVLFFCDGELLDSKVEDLQGEDAAYEIFSWVHVNLSIQNDCAIKGKRIDSDMQQIVLEAARRQDEADDNIAPAEIEESSLLESDPATTIKSIQEKIETAIGPSCGIEDIHQDNSWANRVIQLAKVGEYFSIGELVLGYIDKGETNDSIVVPGEKTIVISVNPKCPRDKIIQLLSE